MGIHLRLENFDRLFNQYSRTEPIIINDQSEASEGEKESFNRLIYTKYNTDLLSNLPSCECGEIVGEHNIGVVCGNCNTPVKAILEQNLEPLVWIRAPVGVTALINPIIWTMLKKKFTRSGFELIRWLCDTTYNPSDKTPAVLQSAVDLNIPRGYNHFVENFDTIMATLFRLRAYKPKKGSTSQAIETFTIDQSVKGGKGLIDPLETLLKEQRNCVFSKYLPLPNRSLMVIEETNVGTYIDPIVVGAVNAIRTMASIDSELSSHNVRTKENRTIKTIDGLSDFYEEQYKTTLARKEGVFRKHVFGTRSHFSFRAVISSSTAKHDYDEIHIPWGIGISVLRIHLVNKLLRRGYVPNEALALLNHHAQVYHPLLDELFQLLIAEAPYKGIPCIFQRNPSLERGSAQAMFITKVKTDPMIPTVSLSILSVVGYNAD